MTILEPAPAETDDDKEVVHICCAHFPRALCGVNLLDHERVGDERPVDCKACIETFRHRYSYCPVLGKCTCVPY